MKVEDVIDKVVSRFIGTKHERDIKRLLQDNVGIF